MTNLDRWLLYTDGLSSPQNYIEWGYRYLIGASLQRRVWIGGDSPDEHALFANSYVVLVGKPGIGKSLVINTVKNFLSFWKLKDSIKMNGETREEDKKLVEAILASDIENAQNAELQVKNKKQDLIDPLLIPIAADATSYEALVEAVAQSYRRINYLKYDENTNKQTVKIYGHSSPCFCLPELVSLLRKRTDDTVNYMLGLYDCPPDYTYKTKTQGTDRVRRGCLNLLGGITPSNMETIFNDHLIGDGFSSRAFFIHAQKNRKSQCFIPPMTPEQLEVKRPLLEHIRNLTALYGPVTIDPDTRAWMEEWWHNYDFIGHATKSPKLEHYFSRKNIHVMKVALMNHFGESLEMRLTKDELQKAIDDLEAEEKNMNLAIIVDSQNPIARIGRKIMEFLATGRKDWVEILVAMNDYANKLQLEEAISFLQETGQVTTEQETDKDTEEKVIYWRIK